MSEVVVVEKLGKQSLLSRGLATGVLMAIAGSSQAAIDITPITTLITEAVTAATAIGVAYLAFVAGMAIYRKLRGAA